MMTRYDGMADKSFVLSYVEGVVCWFYVSFCCHATAAGSNPFRIYVALAPEFLHEGKENIIVNCGGGGESLMAF